MLYCELELNFINTYKDFCCRFTKRKSLKFTEEKDKFFSVHNFKKVTVFSKHLKQDNMIKSLSRSVTSDNLCRNIFFQLASSFKTNPFRTTKNYFNCAIKNASLLWVSKHATFKETKTQFEFLKELCDCFLLNWGIEKHNL